MTNDGIMENNKVMIKKLESVENWNSWKFQTKIVLQAAELFQVVSGECVRPIAAGERGDENLDQQLKDWNKRDVQAKMIISTSIGDQALSYIMSCETSKAMWDKLHAVYEQNTRMQLHLLQQKFFAYKKLDHHDMATHLAVIENMARSIRDLGEPIPDSMLITKMLITLPSSYNHFHSAWESTIDENKTLQNLTNRLMMEEVRMKLQESPRNYNQNGGERSYNSDSQQRYFTRGASGRVPDNRKCFDCGKTGHIQRFCDKRVENKKENTYYASEFCLTCSVGNNGENGWFIDTGASAHMCKDRYMFSYLEDFIEPISVCVGDGTVIHAYGKGKVPVEVFLNEKTERATFDNVLYVPKLKVNLFSPNNALDKGFKMKCDKDTCEFYLNGDKTLIANRSSNELFKLQIKVAQKNYSCFVSRTRKKESLKIWHERFAHQNVTQVKSVLQVANIEYIDQKDFFCEACVLGKMHRLPFESVNETGSYAGETIVVDLCGEFQVESTGGNYYFVIFKDLFSKYKKVLFLRQRRDIIDELEDTILEIERECGNKIKKIRTDNAAELTSIEFDAVLKKYGIFHQKSCPQTPQQNGSAEREIRTVMELARTMLHAKKLDYSLWGEAVHTAVFVLNRSGPSRVNGKSPFEVWFQKRPNVQFLKVFGSTAFMYISETKRRRLDPKGKKGVFVGYSDSSKGYRIYFEDTNSVELSRNVVFPDETKLLCSTQVHSPQEEIEIKINLEDKVDKQESLIQENHCMEEMENIDQILSKDDNSSDVAVNDNLEKMVTNVQLDTKSDRNIVEDNFEFTNDAVNNLENNEMNEKFSDFQDCPEELDDVEGINLTRPIRTIKKPNWMEDFYCFLAEPQNAKEAMVSPNWKNAMDEEMASLMKNETWDLVSLPEGKNIIDNRWVFTTKYKSNGDVERYKARLVVRGFTQSYGIDYEEIFSPVAKLESIRIILALSAARNMKLAQFDIKTAFLNGDLPEEIYMKQPEGFQDDSQRVCRLKKSLYGLKQSPRCWNRKFTYFLKEYGLKASDADSCIFYKETNNSMLYLAIYVDDGLVASHDEKELSSLLKYLSDCFEVKIGDFDLFLGLQIRKYDNGSLFIHQSSYVNKMLVKFGLDQCNPCLTPVDTNLYLDTVQRSNENINFPYREAVGSLMYLAIGTRPDIAYIVNYLSQFNEKPTHEHCSALKRVFRYIQGTKDHGLYYSSDSKFQLKGFCDSDFAGDVNTRKSRSGAIIQIGDSTVSWFSKKQLSVAISTTEAEFMAASEGVRTLIWIDRLYKELTPELKSEKPVLFLDNQSAIKLIKNPEFHSRTKHIDIRVHFIRDYFEKGLFDVNYINTKDQLADILTKGLSKDQFNKLRDLMGIQKN